MNIRRFKQFSIASILVLTAIIAFAIRFWPESECVQSRVENWTEHFWFDYGVGVVRQTGLSNIWEEYSVVSGQGTLCFLRAGSWIKNTTGGSYYSMMVQLPTKIEVGDEFEIRPFHTPNSNVAREIREMDLWYNDCNAIWQLFRVVARGRFNELHWENHDQRTR